MVPNWLIPTVSVVGSAFLWNHSLEISSRIANSGTVGPAFLPRLVLTGLILVGLVQLGQVIVSRRGIAPPGAQDDAPAESFYWWDLAIGATLSGFYVALLYLTGFVPATLLFQAAMLVLVFRQFSIKMVILVPLALTTAYFVIFIRLLEMPLPQGTGWFRTFSRIVYY